MHLGSQALLSVRSQSGYTVATITGELGGAPGPAPAVLTALRLIGLDTYFEIVAPGVPSVKTMIPNGPSASALATL